MINLTKYHQKGISENILIKRVYDFYEEIIQEEPSTPPDVSNNSSLKNISISTPPDETKAIGSRPSARSKSTDYGCSSIPLHLNSPEDGESIPANGIVNKRLTKHKFVKTNSAPLMNTRQISEESIEELNHISGYFTFLPNSL